MDIISFNEASTANGRIESFIENPDSTSGVLTVPKTIAAGETITIPAGRVAILPDVQVDGNLVVDGDLFIPTGSMTSQVVQKVASTDNAIVRFDGVTGQVQDSSILIDDSGNLNITGVGKRITGDFSNATPRSRTAFQTSTTNGVTVVSVIPNGTATLASLASYGKSDCDNSHFGQIVARVDAITIDSTKSGTGSYMPLKLGIGGSYPLVIGTDGSVLVQIATGFGYGTGAGGTVTQLTSKSTAVTLNKPSGIITMNNAALAAGASVIFPFYNSTMSSSDQLIVNMQSVISGYNNYKVENAGAIGGGGNYIRLTNISGVSLSESPTIIFTVLKGAIA